MINFRERPFRKIADVMTTSTRMKPVIAAIMGMRNAKLQSAALLDTNKVTDSAAVGAGASVTLWTPAAGNIVQIGYVVLSVTVAQLYQITVQGTAYITVLMPANTPIVLYQSWPGFFAYPVNGVVAVKNGGGSAADIHCNVWGTEVVG